MAKFIGQLKPLLMKTFKYVPITTDENYAPEEMELKDVEYYDRGMNVRGKSPHKIKFTFVNGDEEYTKYTDGGDPNGKWFDLMRIARELVGNRFELPKMATKTILQQQIFIERKQWGSCDITGRDINWWDRRHDGCFPVLLSSDNTYWICAPAVRFVINLQASVNEGTRAISLAKMLPMGLKL